MAPALCWSADDVPCWHVGFIDLFDEAWNVTSDEDDVSDDQVDSAERCLWCADGDVNISTTQRWHRDLARYDDRLTFEDVVGHRGVVVDRRLTESHRRHCGALHSQHTADIFVKLRSIVLTRSR